ncbi:MAG: EpsI family protein [Cephaloticoccus sp.]|nr:EpsI family protein [Cephaloticoccus sp.]MCF7760659.1 EpsI family protein [Cephaloticoccus sp.]
MTRNLQSRTALIWSAVACAAMGFAVFQFWGNATQGYIESNSLFYWWGFQWANAASEMEHGWMILGLSLWLFWRNALQLPVAPNPAQPGRALLAMGVGLGLHVLGYAVQQSRISILGLLVFVWGVLVLAGGKRWGRAAAFPLAFMIFALPINVLDTAGFWLRMWVIEASHTLAHWSGIEVVRNGTQLFSPDGRYQYDVAAACSGVRSLLALTALSLLVGYLNLRSWWARGLVLVLSFPFTYLGNVVRISAIILAAQLWGQDAGMIVHEWAGFVVFVIVLGLVQLSVGWLGRLVPGIRLGAPDATAPFWSTPAANDTGQFFLRDLVVRVGPVFLLALGTVGLTRHFDALPLRSETGVRLTTEGINPVPLPAFIGVDWIGRQTAVTAIEREILPPDTGYARRNYVALHQPGHQVFLSIVLSGRDRTSIHRPELCVTGQGWTITSRFDHDFVITARDEITLPTTVLRVEQVDTRTGRIFPALLAYWFVNSDRMVATHWERMAYAAWDRLRHGRADRWAYVLVQTDAVDGEAAALTRLQEVLAGTVPEFQKPLPQR